MISRLLSFAAAAGLVAAPIAGQAQQTMGQGNLLGLPSDLSMLQDSDPNHRVATAVVNGYVVTETDVDQRAALLLAANQTPVSEEELVRLRMQVLRNLIDETLQIQAAEAQELEVPAGSLLRCPVAAQFRYYYYWCPEVT